MSQNIRVLRQQFNDARHQMRLNNADFLAEVERDLDSATGPEGKRALRAKVLAHTKKFVDEKPQTKDADTILDGWFALIDVLDAEIAAMSAGNQASGGVTAGGWFVENQYGEREPIHVLAPNESVRNVIGRPSASAVDRPPLGDYLRGIVGGVRNPAVRAALAEGVDSAGGYSIPTEVLGEFIDRLRAATCFVQAGARTVILEGARTRVLRVASDPVAAWRAENSAVVESEPTFDAIDFDPKSLACLVKVSNELLADTVNAGDALVQALTAAMALQLDYAAFFGSGVGNEPRGLDSLAGVPTVTLGTGNGAAPDWDMLLDAEYQIDLGNGGPVTAAISHPRTWKDLRKLKDGQGQYLMPPAGWAKAQESATAGNGVPQRLQTTAYPIEQTVGTSADCSTAHVGNFSRAILGLRQQLTIRRLDQAFAGHLQTGFLAYLRADVQFEQAAAFAKVKGIRS